MSSLIIASISATEEAVGGAAGRNAPNELTVRVPARRAPETRLGMKDEPMEFEFHYVLW